MISKKAFEHYQQGQAFEEKKHYEKALSAYEQAIHLDPDTASFHIACGRMLALLGLYGEAERAFTRATQIDATQADAYGGCAHALHQLQQYEQAVKMYRQAAQLNPNDADLYNGLGITLCKLERFSEAIGAFRIAIRLRSDCPPYHHNLGHAFQQAYRYRDALDEFNKAIDLDPDYVRAYHQKGKLLFHLHREQEALDCLALALKLEPGNKDLLSEYNRAVAAQNVVQTPIVPPVSKAIPARVPTKNTKQSKVASAKNSVKIPANEAVLLRQAKMFYQEKQYEASLEIYQEILRQKRRDKDAWLGSIRALFQLGQWDAAINMCNDALKCVTKKAKKEIYHLKGDILLASGRYQGAKIAYDCAQPHGYASEDLQKKVAWVKQKIKPVKKHTHSVVIAVQGTPTRPAEKRNEPGKGYKRYRTSIERPALAKLNLIPSLLERGEVLLKYRYYKEAQEAFEQLLLEDAHNARAYHGLGCALRAQGEEEKSLQAFHKAQKFGL